MGASSQLKRQQRDMMASNPNLRLSIPKYSWFSNFLRSTLLCFLMPVIGCLWVLVRGVVLLTIKSDSHNQPLYAYEMKKARIQGVTNLLISFSYISEFIRIVF